MSGGTGPGRLPEQHLITDTEIDESDDDGAGEARGGEGTGRGGVGAAVSVVGGSGGGRGGGGGGLGRGRGGGGGGGADKVGVGRGRGGLRGGVADRVGRGSGRGRGGGGDGVGREDGVEGASRGGNECFDFDIALLCGDEEIAYELLFEMGTVKLDNNRSLRVVDYTHPTFGGSIIETPGNVLRRCRFVFVLIEENTEEGGELRYARNELVALVKLKKQNQHRFDCVRPLLREEEDHAEMEMPSGLEDAVKVYWPGNNRERSEAKLVLLIQESIDKDSQVITKPCSWYHGCHVSIHDKLCLHVSLEEGEEIRRAAGPSMSSSASSSTTSFSSLTENMTEGRMSATTAKLLSIAAESVGRIGGGTGLRVGSRYIMTASHVVKMALGFCELTPVTFDQIQQQLEKQGLDIHFTFSENLKPIPVQKIVFYLDRRDQDDGDFLDVTIAELEPGYSLPDPLINFYDDFGTDTPKKICFLGHDCGSKDIELGFSWTLVDGLKLEAISSRILQQSLAGPSEMKIFDRCGKDPRRVQLQGPFRKGGSGSPGVIVSDGKVKIFAILTHGHFFRPNVPNSLQIQEGTRMGFIKEFLKQENVTLCEDIFHGWDSRSSEESSTDVI